jgi:hypothetical protein
MLRSSTHSLVERVNEGRRKPDPIGRLEASLRCRPCFRCAKEKTLEFEPPDTPEDER